MKNNKPISILFYISGIFDGVLGIVFVFIPKIPFVLFNVTHPNHWGYIQFPAALLVVFACMFFAIARNPGRNRNLIPYGIGLKASYSIVVFGYWITTGLPDMWKPFAVIDVILGLLFIWAYITLGKQMKIE
jgi:hypothetical protein